ncbi:hypothetical protein C7M51_00790 [Mixta intestinalis]|uniref:Uncharacterized protein n=1 Tax=Mixta intestinalis TaxID=1615494 RepID=A0A6P1PX34_9GAMM|nr:hypothetical protein C7M51_00790 [Mixta intestinalis]
MHFVEDDVSCFMRCSKEESKLMLYVKFGYLKYKYKNRVF